jgi:hypothetical protein
MGPISATKPLLCFTTRWEIHRFLATVGYVGYQSVWSKLPILIIPSKVLVNVGMVLSGTRFKNENFFICQIRSPTIHTVSAWLSSVVVGSRIIQRLLKTVSSASTTTLGPPKKTGRLSIYFSHACWNFFLMLETVAEETPWAK